MRFNGNTINGEMNLWVSAI